MVYANPVLSEMASGAFYDQDAAKYYLSPAKLESDYSPVRFEREKRIFRRFCKSGRVLDVGCSSGAFLYQLQQQFPGDYECLGTDASGAPLDYAEGRGVRVFRGDFLKMRGGTSQFDAVTFWAVLEHLLDPKAFLKCAYDLLRPGGYCFVLVPNIESLAFRLLREKYRYVLWQHFNYFSSVTLRKIASDFDLRSMSSSHLNPIVMLQDAKGRDVSDSERATLLQKTTRYKQSVALKPLKCIYSGVEALLAPLLVNDNLIAVLQKPSR